jgi:hypothetical protein
MGTIVHLRKSHLSVLHVDAAPSPYAQLSKGIPHSSAESPWVLNSLHSCKQWLCIMSHLAICYLLAAGKPVSTADPVNELPSGLVFR